MLWLQKFKHPNSAELARLMQYLDRSDLASDDGTRMSLDESFESNQVGSTEPGLDDENEKHKHKKKVEVHYIGFDSP